MSLSIQQRQHSSKEVNLYLPVGSPLLCILLRTRYCFMPLGITLLYSCHYGNRVVNNHLELFSGHSCCLIGLSESTTLAHRIKVLPQFFPGTPARSLGQTGFIQHCYSLLHSINRI